jgi:hypothetical protein
VRGIKHNVHLLNSYFLAYNKPDILLLSETWSNMDDIHLHIPHGFNVASSFVRSNFIRGGVSIFSNEKLALKDVDVSYYCIEKVFECCCSYVKAANEYIIFMAVYRSSSAPIASFSLQLKQCLSMINCKFGTSSFIILGGDQNINFLSDSNSINYFLILLVHMAFP